MSNKKPPFNLKEREDLYNSVLAIGNSDERITGGALVGSMATGNSDDWSDIDISFGVKEGLKPKDILDEWTALLSKDFDILDYFDLPSGKAIYRVLLFNNGLEMDLSVVPESDFGKKGPGFNLLFGKAIEETPLPKSKADRFIGLAWHHVIHANTAIHRGKHLSAATWISKLREHLTSMICIRHDIPWAHGKEADKLPQKEKQALAGLLVANTGVEELNRALNAGGALLVSEVKHLNPELADQLNHLFSKLLV